PLYMVDLLFLHSPTLSIPAPCPVAPCPLSRSHYTNIQARVKKNCTSLPYAPHGKSCCRGHTAHTHVSPHLLLPASVSMYRPVVSKRQSTDTRLEGNQHV